MIELASMQRQYELMVILRPDFGVEEKKIRDAVTKLVGETTIKELTVMGKKQLAYPIKKQVEGVYALAILSGKPVAVGDLERQMKLGTDVIRYLLIGKE